MHSISKNQLILGLVTCLAVLIIMLTFSGGSDKVIQVVEEDNNASELTIVNHNQNQDVLNNLSQELESMRDENNDQNSSFDKIMKQMRLLEENQKLLSEGLNNSSTESIASINPELDDAQDGAKAGTIIEQQQTEFRPDLVIENGMDAEAIDPNWSVSASESISDLFASGNKELQGISLTNVECKTSLCRVELTFDSVDGMDATKLAMGNMPWNAEGFFKLNTDDDNPSAVIYLARENHQLPRDIAGE